MMESPFVFYIFFSLNNLKIIVYYWIDQYEVGERRMKKARNPLCMINNNTNSIKSL